MAFSVIPKGSKYPKVGSKYRSVLAHEIRGRSFETKINAAFNNVMRVLFDEKPNINFKFDFVPTSRVIRLKKQKKLSVRKTNVL